MSGRLVSLLALALAATIARVAGAEPSARVEGVGAVPADAALASRVDLRQQALRAGLAEAVERVAFGLAARGGTRAPDPDRIAAALGPDPFRYVVRFRMLEDRGVHPRLLVVDPDVESEYEVLVEAEVDLARVRSALVAAGVIPPRGTQQEHQVQVIVEGLQRYRDLERLAATLARAPSRSATPVELERGRATLALLTPLGAGELAARLLREIGPGALEAEADGPERLVVHVLGPLPDSGPAEAGPSPQASGKRGPGPAFAD